jgi:PKD repeat protein
MRIGAFLTTAVVLGMGSTVYANPPTELFPEQANVAATGPYGLSASAGDINLTGPASGSPFISLKLPGGRTVLLEKTGFEARTSGGALWRGKVPDHAASQALLTVYQDLMFGRITVDGEVYEIRPGAKGQHIVEQLDPSAFPGCDTGDDQISSGGGTVTASADTATAGTTQFIDLLSVYTANARTSAGGATAVEGLIQSAVDTANAAFIESNMNVRYRLVHAEEVAFNNAATTTDGLDWVTDDPGVAALRDEYGADMVSLMVDSPSSCGTAWIQRSPSRSFRHYAFQSTDIDCAVGNLTFAHEHGHNMGMEHNIENSSVGSDPSLASYDFSFAHFVDASFRTVMSYESPCPNGCTRVARFSNPDVQFAGVTTGIAGQSDNAETGRLTAAIIQDFRDSVVSSSSPINIRIAQSADDVEESTSNGNMLLDSTDLEFGYDNAEDVGSEQMLGLRFLNVGIPQGATITNAYLEFTVDETGTATTVAEIRAIDVDSAAGFNATAYDLSNRPMVGTRPWDIPAWNTVGALRQSPDISGLVQAVVNRAGWASGNNIAFTIASSGDRTAEAWDGVAEAAPLLHVEYEGGAAPSNIEPSAGFSVSTSDLDSTFTDSSSDPDGTITSWSWDFGDGNSSANRNPAHGYAAAGVYTVRLTVLDDQGASAAASQSVTTSEPTATATAPSAPSNLTKSVQQSGKGKKKVITGASLSWSDNSNNETAFVVQRCQETTSGKGKNRSVSCPWSDYTNVGSNVRTVDVATTSGYKYRVKAMNETGSSGYSNDVKI